MNNLDDLMAVWRSQDAAPLHGVNETLLGLALRQDEKKLRKQRRMEEWSTYLTSACLVGGLALAMVNMYAHKGGIADWDFLIPIAGVLSLLLWGGALHVSRRAQMRREQSYGASLRDQISLHIAQLDYQMSGTVRLANTLVATLPLLAGAIALMIAINLAFVRIPTPPHAPFESWVMNLIVILGFAYAMFEDIRKKRRMVQLELLPRKQQLETLLKELEN